MLILFQDPAGSTELENGAVDVIPCGQQERLCRILEFLELKDTVGDGPRSLWRHCVLPLLSIRTARASICSYTSVRCQWT